MGIGTDYGAIHPPAVLRLLAVRVFYPVLHDALLEVGVEQADVAAAGRHGCICRPRCPIDEDFESGSVQGGFALYHWAYDVRVRVRRGYDSCDCPCGRHARLVFYEVTLENYVVGTHGSSWAARRGHVTALIGTGVGRGEGRGQEAEISGAHGGGGVAGQWDS